MGRRARLTAALLIVTATSLSGGRLEAQVYYTVNGRPAPPSVARYMAGYGLRPGHYWLAANGYWGVVGNPIPLGNVNAAGNRGAPRPGLSQRGMLYRPGEILNGR